MSDPTFGEVIGGRPQFQMRLKANPDRRISHEYVCPTCNLGWDSMWEAAVCYEKHGGMP